jgi:hypothetical protein
MQYNVFGSKHRSNVQGNEASIVEFGNKHGNRDEFPDFVDLFIFGIKNVRVGRSETYFFFGNKNSSIMVNELWKMAFISI